MIKKKSFSVLTSLMVVGLVATTGCVDSGEKTDCVGLSCPSGFFWPEGGEFRLQYIGLPDGSDLRYMTSFFVADQDPQQSALAPFGLCGYEPDWLAVNSRTYTDVGPSVTAHLPELELVAARSENQTDFLRRHHDLAYLAETFEPATLDFFSARHTATLSAETAGDFDFSENMNTLYMPPKLEIVSPIVEPGGVLEIKSGQDLLIEWKEVQEREPGILTGGVIAFDSPGSDVVSCIVPNTGRFVIPAAVIDEQLASGGVMQVGTGSNEAILSGAAGEERILSQWGANCTLVPWVKVD